MRTQGALPSSGPPLKERGAELVPETGTTTIVPLDASNKTLFSPCFSLIIMTSIVQVVLDSDTRAIATTLP